MGLPTRKHDDIFRELARRFSSDDEKTLPKAAGAKSGIKYVTARTLMNRLDNVLGPENWWDDYAEVSSDAVLCRLTIRLPDGSTLTKCDAGGYAPMKADDDRVKSGYSDAFKRACYKFGIARYLYRDGSASFPDVTGPERATLEDASTGPLATSGESVHHGSHTEAAPALPESATVGTPAESKGQAVDDRSLWIFLTDEVMRCNVAFQEEFKEEGEIVIPQEVVMHLVYLTWEAALHPMAPTENTDTPMSKWVNGVLEPIYKMSPKHAERLRARTVEFLRNRYEQKAREQAPPSSRGPR